MRRLGILLLTLALGGSAAAQQSQEMRKADGKEAITEGADRRIGGARFDSIVSRPAAYHLVLDKFRTGVVRPSVEECTIAYYGFALQNFFSPRPEGETRMQSAVMAGEWESSYLAGVQVLEKSPVNLTALYWTLRAAVETDQPWEVRNSLRARYNGISFVIRQSGTGTTADSALRVIFTGDMYTYATMELDLEIGDGYLLDGRWTVFEVTPSPKYPHSRIYFELWPYRGEELNSGKE